ncbi:MAG TPA: hypothetical protein PLT76_03760 [Candidatus Omnitrophota bacterium]|nr:hypothetical protein [Candidatus Omnitrophota bacterium]HQO57816.1 hypothetical protein [Candidatus Omnitrophota bacterium]HQP12786.1 hypothetical protein [Candidatus Omnitrophota bacterium]
MILLMGCVGVIFIAVGTAVFFRKKNKVLSVTLVSVGVIYCVLSGILWLAVLHFGEAPRDGTESQVLK